MNMQASGQTIAALPLARGPEHPPLQRHSHQLLDRHRAVLPADRLHRLSMRNCACRRWRRRSTAPRLPRLLRVWLSHRPSSSAWCCCLRRCRRGSRRGGLAGFAITLGSALIAHLSVGVGPAAGGWGGGHGVLWGALRHIPFWRSAWQATPASA